MKPQPGFFYATLKNSRDTFDCTICGRKHDAIYCVHRNIYPVTNYAGAYVNGRFQAIEHGLPTELDRKPTRSVRIEQQQAEKMWHEVYA